jgi:hypothetical protein
VPRNRGETIVFSKNAVITMRNGFLYLVRERALEVVQNICYSCSIFVFPMILELLCYDFYHVIITILAMFQIENVFKRAECTKYERH